MANWGTLRRELETDRWQALWRDVESTTYPIDDVTRFIVRHCRTPERCRGAYAEGKWLTLRCEGHYPRTLQTLREWARLNDAAEHDATRAAARTGAPVPFMSATNRRGAAMHLDHSVFDRVGGQYALDLPVVAADAPPEWTAPLRYEHRAVVTPSGLYCHLHRAPRAELARCGARAQRDAGLLTRLDVRRVATHDTAPPNAPIDDALTELCIRHDEVLWIDERALGFTPHTIMRQDDHGQDFEVETFPSRHAAAERVRAFEAAAHKQHYWTVSAPSHDPALLTYATAGWETLERALEVGRRGLVWEVVEAMEAPVEEVARRIWDHLDATEDLHELAGMAAGILRRRRRTERPPPERMTRVLELWTRWSGEREAAAISRAKTRGEPVPFRALPARVDGAWAGVPRGVFDATPGHYGIDEPVYGIPSDGGGELIQYEYKSLVTPTGVLCVLRRATERELRLFGHWERGALLDVDVMLERPLPYDDEGFPRVMGRLLDDALTGLGVPPDEVVWSNDDPCFIPHTLMRQDDNGHDYEVETFPSKHAATARMRALDALTHTQHYWVTPA